MVADSPAIALTRQQRRTLEAIDCHWRSMGYAPSIRDLMRLLSYESSSGPYLHLTSLLAMGLVDWQFNIARSVRLTDEGFAALEEIGVSR